MQPLSDLLRGVFPIRFRILARWSHNMATCLAAGIDLRQAIGTSSGAIRLAAPSFHQVIAEIDRGEPLSAALRPAADQLPEFFIPVVASGEEAGRLEETLHFLADHCEHLDRPQQALRQLWLAPLAIYLAGQTLGGLAQLFFGTWNGTLRAGENLLISIGSLLALVIVWRATPFRYLLDQVRFWVPVLGAAERELVVHRFLHVFALLYSAGSQRVDSMLRQSCRAVGNEWLRRDLLRTVEGVRRGETLTDAFRATTTLSPQECDELAIGEEAGRLAETAGRMAARAGESAAAKLLAISAVTNRLAAGFAVFSLVGTISYLILLAQFR